MELRRVLTALAALGSLIGIGAILSSRPYPRDGQIEPPPDHQTNNPRHESGEAEYPKPQTTSPHSTQHCWHSEEREHRRKERRYWSVQNVVSPLALAFSLVAILAGIGSAILASKALIASQQAATAARDQANTSLDTERRQLMAYVAAMPSSIIMQNDFHPFQVVTTFRNVGTTPAYKVETNGMLLVMTKPIPSDFGFLLVYDPRPPSRAMLSPSVPLAVSQTLGWRLTPQEVVQIQSFVSMRRLLTYGTVTYNDGFGVGHRMNYCYWVTFIEENGVISDKSVQGAACDRHNDGD